MYGKLHWWCHLDASGSWMALCLWPPGPLGLQGSFQCLLGARHHRCGGCWPHSTAGTQLPSCPSQSCPPHRYRLLRIIRTFSIRTYQKKITNIYKQEGGNQSNTYLGGLPEYKYLPCKWSPPFCWTPSSRTSNLGGFMGATEEAGGPIAAARVSFILALASWKWAHNNYTATF